MMLDMTGKHIGKLKVLHFSHKKENKNYWICECECGYKSIKSTSHLNEAIKLKSNIGCLCAHKESIKKAHQKYIENCNRRGVIPKKLKYMYDNMRKRCYKPGTNRYERYGGRGIRICDEWLGNRRAFYGWAIEHGWKEGLSIDRINNDSNYSPENCRFVSIERQQANTSRSRFIEWQGKRKIISDWARELGVNPKALQHRLERGWSVERMMTQPFRGHYS